MPASDTFTRRPHARLRYLIVWSLFAGMKCVARLPFRWQLALGRWFGQTGRLLGPKRAEVARKNISACFPELSPLAVDDLVRRHYTAIGQSFVEMGMGWYGNHSYLTDRVRIEGLEHLAAALARGRGVILYSAHFTPFEIFFPLLRQHCGRLCGMYKAQRNPLMNEIMTAGRGRNFDCLFTKDDVRTMLRELSRNAVIWYAPDQSFDGKSSALLPFFGVPAQTNIAINRFARSSGAAVLPYFCRRPGDSIEYVANILPQPENIPSEDAEADTLALTALLEDYIRLCPEQYWWVHQKFKGRPDSLPDFYAADSTR